MVNKIFASSGLASLRSGSAISRISEFGPSYVVNKTATAVTYKVIDASGNTHQTRNESASYALSTGTNATGMSLFSNANGGTLSSITIVNRGTPTVYIGFNQTAMATSGGFPLQSGESTQQYGLITKAWAITSSGNGSLDVLGIYAGSQAQTPLR